MSLIVQKYGGTSVGTLPLFQSVARRVAYWKNAGYDLVVVVSAMAGETNRMMDMATFLQNPPDARDVDLLLSTGEQAAIALLSLALKKAGVQAVPYTAGQVPIVTDSHFGTAYIQHIDCSRLQHHLSCGHVPVVAGFQGVDQEGHVTTLGRGGSDITAIALAAFLSADECQIYTDVPGVYTADPHFLPNARFLKTVTFEEMLEMSSSGSRILMTRCIGFAYRYGVRIRVLSSDSPYDSHGTLILMRKEEDMMEGCHVSAMAFSRAIARVHFWWHPLQQPNSFLPSMVDELAHARIALDMVAQTLDKNGCCNFSCVVPQQEVHSLCCVVRKRLARDSLEYSEGYAKVALIGLGMATHFSVVSQVLKELALCEVNIHMLSVTEIKVLFLIHEKDLERTVCHLHQAFHLSSAIEKDS